MKKVCVGVGLSWLWMLLTLLAVNAQAVEGPSPESRHVAKAGAMPFNPRYLYPSSKESFAMDWLTLPEERIMALTFDDGPDERDLAIAALLDSQEIPATFFYIGNKIKVSPHIVKEMAGKKHELGYHSYRHQQMSWLSAKSLTADFRQGKEVLEKLGLQVTWFRPPYGDFNYRVVQEAKDQGMETVLWTIDSRDWAGIPSAIMARNVIRRFHPGAVILFHSTHANTLRALPEILQAATRERYRFVTLAEWRRTIQTASCRVKKSHCPEEPLTVASPSKELLSEEGKEVPVTTLAPAAGKVIPAATTVPLLPSSVIRFMPDG
ncbi:polysaccharide deacetylase family protein [Candidatus Magnetaquicoccus inordinatus]|uniref:polysaccharide deacetylase family protein n=1 Tax=Candidatus Magnetaquicoccus inordinatus TaxID=2496818 RepID=UPI00187D53FD|nr:polysaccharide deacetylase family protein [Candidatus Magnetaquicoccus inordinatus]